MDEYYSGVSQYTANLLAAILRTDEAGANIEVKTKNEYQLFYNSYHNLSARLNKWQTPNSKIVAWHYPNKIFNYLLQKLFHYPRLDKALGGVDLFWSPHFNFTSLSGPASGLKKIITVHDLSFLRYPEFFNWRKNIWHCLLGVKTTLRRADKIIAVSENTKNDIMELVGIPADKIAVIYSGNNIKKQSWSENEVDAVLNKWDLNFGSRFILYVGNIEPRKNIFGLIEAYEALRRTGEELARRGERDNFKDLFLVLAGTPGWKTRKIYEAFKKSPYKNQIKFTGHINEEEKGILYSQAQVFVYPSFYEGFGFPPLEAMTYGVPVIAANVSSLPEVVADAALMIDPNKSSEIKEALITVLGDEALRQQLIVQGYKRASLFTWEKTAQEYLRLFKEIKG